MSAPAELGLDHPWARNPACNFHYTLYVLDVGIITAIASLLDSASLMSLATTSRTLFHVCYRVAKSTYYDLCVTVGRPDNSECRSLVSRIFLTFRQFPRK